ncbi:hypothetical protein ACTG9Q_13495 [Actinokineospora sp. 24-640]
MEQRRLFDVSTEALLRRLTTTADRPVTLVAASRYEDTSDSPLLVDYVVTSSTSAPDFARGSRVPGIDVLGGCTAVGQTVRGSATADGSAMRVQAVGTPPYPGRLLPRVLALIEPESGRPNEAGIEYRTGDVTDAHLDGPAVIAHVVNDSARAWGKRGVARALAARFPGAAQAFRSWAVASSHNLVPGMAHIVTTEAGDTRVDIASVVAQRGYGPGVRTRLDYAALRTALERVSEHALGEGLAVHLPRIGTGQAGGRWDLVVDILRDVVVRKGARVVVHTIPAQRSTVEG